MSNEIIEKTDIHIGLLHRNTEFLIETKHYEKSIPYFDRLDYVSMMAQEHAFACIAEEQNSIEIVAAAQEVRIIMLEVTRILNHLMSITTHAMDVGALTPFL